MLSDSVSKVFLSFIPPDFINVSVLFVVSDICPNISEAFYLLLAAPSLPATHFAVVAVTVMTLRHNAEQNQRARDSDVRTRGKPCEGVRFGSLYSNAL